jgi:hypothetical protein
MRVVLHAIHRLWDLPITVKYSISEASRTAALAVMVMNRKKGRGLSCGDRSMPSRLTLDLYAYMAICTLTCGPVTRGACDVQLAIKMLALLGPPCRYVVYASKKA